MRKVSSIVGLFVAVLGFAGCQATTVTTGPISERLQAEDPDVRIQAAVEAGNTGDKEVIPLLVERLSDSNRDVRFFSGLALERIVGKETYQNMGWVSYDPPEQRDNAIRRWRQWVRTHYGMEATQPAATQPS